MSDANTSVAQQTSHTVTRLSIIRDVSLKTLDSMSSDDLANPACVEKAVLKSVNSEIEMVNAVAPKGAQKFKYLDAMLPAQIADAIVRSGRVVKIAAAGMSEDKDLDVLAVYRDEGPYKGIYDTSEVTMRSLVRKYNYNITKRDAAEVMAVLQEMLPRVPVCTEPNLVAVNNGIFDYETKKLLPFSPDYVFMSKCKVDYDGNAQNVTIHNDDDGTDWDVESWMESLSDDPEVVNVLWEILGAIIRPLVPWNKSAWFYSEQGNNGKGTLCELMKQLCGEESYASIPLSDFGKDFMLEPLMRASAIIVDENDVGTYIDKAANLKAVITGDTIQINRKFKAPIAYKFRGFMVQCLNEMPRIRDKSDSFFRRQLFIPFTKCFTGNERKYIKADYLHRKEVLEYVLKRVLNMSYYSLSTPKACDATLEEYKEFVDPVRAFLADVMPALRWDFVPSAFLYDLYVKWYQRNIGNDRNIKGKNGFLKDVRLLIKSYYPEWEESPKPVHAGTMMQTPEPLIAEYMLENWFSPGIRISDMRNNLPVEKTCIPAQATSYRGFRRVAVSD